MMTAKLKPALARGALLGLLLACGASTAGAQRRDDDDPVAQRAKRQRQGAGLRVGLWAVQDLSGDDSRWPNFEGYFQRGIDLHLAVESSIGLWRRQQTTTSGGPLGGGSEQDVTSYVVPLFTALKLYFTRPAQPFEPFVNAGVGFAVGIEDCEGGGTLTGCSGTSMLTGFGFKGGAGAEARLGRAFGLQFGARYQWVKFGDDVGGERTFKGPGFDVGLTYRFQYE